MNGTFSFLKLLFFMFNYMLKLILFKKFPFINFDNYSTNKAKNIDILFILDIEIE